ncbi:MAG: diguanylate cyclase, partial [Giesbergeria sp.]
MALLHTPTLLLMIVLVSALMGLAMVTVAWGARHEGLQFWAAGLGINSLAYLFFGLRGTISDPISIVLGNGLTSLALCYLLAAVLRFHGQALRWPLLLLPSLVLSAAMFGLLGNFQARLVVASLVLAAQSAAIVRAMYVHRQSTIGRGALLVVWGTGLLLLVMLLRALSGITGILSLQTFLQDSAVQGLTFVSTFAASLVTSLGFVFMTKERADEANRRLAALDELTGVANRRFIIAALDRDVARAIRTRECIAVMMVDIDHFKRVNDTYGHLAGDHVLRCVVDVIQNRIRTQDIVGRYGGEEFLVVLANTSAQGAQQLAEQLRAAIHDARCVYAGDTLSVDVSIGVFGGRLEPGDSWDQLIHAADMALYRAKQSGRNRVELTE